jgi:ABC-type sugar transport system permease subunit
MAITSPGPSAIRTAAETTPKTRRRSRPPGSTRQMVAGYGFIAPFIVLFALFSAWPDIYSLILSFEKYSGYGPAVPVGLANYKALLTYPAFWTEVENTLFYWVVHAVILIPIAFVLALIVRGKMIRGKRFWKPIIFLPQVMSIVAISLVFNTLFSQHFGVINSLLGINVAWLTDFSIARWIVVLLLVWEGVGFWFVVFLAGLTGIDPAVEEAAMVDGAGSVRRAIFILVPMMKNVLLFAAVIDAINSMALYTEPNILTAAQGGSLAVPAVGTISNMVVGNLESGTFGESAAAGWLLFILTLLVGGAVFGVFRLVGGRIGVEK